MYCAGHSPSKHSDSGNKIICKHAPMGVDSAHVVFTANVCRTNNSALQQHTNIRVLPLRPCPISQVLKLEAKTQAECAQLQMQKPKPFVNSGNKTFGDNRRAAACVNSGM